MDELIQYVKRSSYHVRVIMAMVMMLNDLEIAHESNVLNNHIRKTLSQLCEH